MADVKISELDEVMDVNNDDEIPVRRAGDTRKIGVDTLRTGLRGIDGANGEAGPRGLQGDMGMDGARGPVGVRGTILFYGGLAIGLSVNNANLFNSYTNTEFSQGMGNANPTVIVGDLVQATVTNRVYQVTENSTNILRLTFRYNAQGPAGADGSGGQEVFILDQPIGINIMSISNQDLAGANMGDIIISSDGHFFTVTSNVGGGTNPAVEYRFSSGVGAQGEQGVRGTRFFYGADDNGLGPLLDNTLPASSTHNNPGVNATINNGDLVQGKITNHVYRISGLVDGSDQYAYTYLYNARGPQGNVGEQGVAGPDGQTGSSGIDVGILHYPPIASLTAGVTTIQYDTSLSDLNGIELLPVDSEGNGAFELALGYKYVLEFTSSLIRTTGAHTIDGTIERTQSGQSNPRTARASETGYISRWTTGGLITTLQSVFDLTKDGAVNEIIRIKFNSTENRPNIENGGGHRREGFYLKITRYT